MLLFLATGGAYGLRCVCQSPNNPVMHFVSSDPLPNDVRALQPFLCAILSPVSVALPTIYPKSKGIRVWSHYTRDRVVNCGQKLVYPTRMHFQEMEIELY